MTHDKSIRSDTITGHAFPEELPIIVTGEYGRARQIDKVVEGLQEYIFSDETRIVEPHIVAAKVHPQDVRYNNSANIYDHLLRNRRGAPNRHEGTVVVGGGIQAASRDTVAFLCDLANMTDDPIMYRGRSLGTTMLDGRIKIVKEPKQILEIVRAHERRGK